MHADCNPRPSTFPWQVGRGWQPCSSLGQHIKEEGVDVVVQRLVIEEELGERAQILAKVSCTLPVDFKHDISTAVDLIPVGAPVRGKRWLGPLETHTQQSGVDLRPKHTAAALHQRCSASSFLVK